MNENTMGKTGSNYEYACVKTKYKGIFLNYGWELVQEVSGICQLRRAVRSSL